MLEQDGIWRYSQVLSPEVAVAQRLSLGEGNTPLDWVEGIGFKREDLNPSGSVKDRGMAYQISRLVEEGRRSFVISSSGNAGISAAKYCALAGVKLEVFVANSMDVGKRGALQELGITVYQGDRPVSSAHRWAVQHEAYNLRPSKDELGTVGYRTLAAELAEEDIGAMFFPVSSGTTFLGVAEGFSRMGTPLPRMFAVQTTALHGVVKDLDSEFNIEDSSVASGIVARSVPRKEGILSVIRETNGSGLVVSNEEIRAAYAWLHERGMKVSYDAAVSLAGLWRARGKGLVKDEKVVCVLTGVDR